MAQTKAGRSNGPLHAWRSNSKRSSRVAYSDVDGTALQRCIDKITANGGAIMLGCTADGGAFSVVVLHQDQKLKEYPNSAESMDIFLEDLAAQFSEAV